MTSKGKQSIKKKRSKRERRTKLIIYIMIFLMLISTLTAGIAMWAI